MVIATHGSEDCLGRLVDVRSENDQCSFPRIGDSLDDDVRVEDASIISFSASGSPESDATILLDIPDNVLNKPWLRDQHVNEQSEQPVLSLVSLNPKTASSVDLLRGQLEVLEELPDPQAGVRIVRVSCGRDLANSVVIKDSRVSLKHFTLTVRAARGGKVAMDILDQSSNGTWVDGRRVGIGNRVTLAIGGRIVPLPAALVGRASEIGYVLVYDTKGSRCKAHLPSCSELPVAPAFEQMKEASVPRNLEQDLCCGICADVLHRCLTITPCGHNFCATCLAKWRRRSPLCPRCRTNVKYGVQNLDVDRMAEAFLHAHPELARSADETAALDRAACEPDCAAALRWLLREPNELPRKFSRNGPLDRHLLNVATPQRHMMRQTGSTAIGAPHQNEQRTRSAACIVS